jgi:hypothetical protein
LSALDIAVNCKKQLIPVCYTDLGGKKMLRTVEAEIKPDGSVTLLEPIDVKTTARALVTVLENGSRTPTENFSEQPTCRQIDLLGAGAPRRRPSMLRSSSISSQCMP